MRRYSKYIIVRLLGPLIFIGGSLLGLIWLSQSLRFIDLIINQGISLFTFLYLSAMLIPSLLNIVLPIALFASIIYTYNKMLTENELIVMQSAGLSRGSLAKPALILTFMVLILGYSITLYLLPKSYREFKDLQDFIRDNYVAVLMQEGTFNTPVKGLTVYVRDKDDRGMLKGILVHDNRSPEKPITMMAESGQLVETPSGPQFELQQGNRQEINYQTQQVSFLYFDSYGLDLSAFKSTSEQRWREPEERYLNELFYPGPDTQDRFKSKLVAEGHNRLTWPLYNLVLALFALSVFLSSELNRRGRWQRILLVSVVAVIFVAAGLSSNNIVAKHNFLAPIMYTNIALGIFIGLTMIMARHPFKTLLSGFKRQRIEVQNAAAV